MTHFHYYFYYSLAASRFLFNVYIIYISVISSQNFEDFDYVIIAMFSHGLNDDQIVHGPFTISLQKALLNPLFGNETLHDKFKWVILQACGGQFDCHAAVADSRPRTSGQRYFVKSLACQEGIYHLQ